MSPNITLHTYAMSPFAAKVHCFLLYKKLDFKLSYINPLKAAKQLPVGHQVPVLTIGKESLNDSTPIGLWLEERFPERPLLPDDPIERDKLLQIDQWISHKLIPGNFRFYPGDGLNRLLNSWKLGTVMKKTSGLPTGMRTLWPLVTTMAPFARRLRSLAGSSMPIKKAKFKLYDDFIERLENGPFLGGRSTPSFPDFSAYPQFALYYATDFHGGTDIKQKPEILKWMQNMSPYLKGKFPMLPSELTRNELPA